MFLILKHELFGSLAPLARKYSWHFSSFWSSAHTSRFVPHFIFWNLITLTEGPRLKAEWFWDEASDSEDWTLLMTAFKFTTRLYKFITFTAHNNHHSHHTQSWQQKLPAKLTVDLSTTTVMHSASANIHEHRHWSLHCNCTPYCVAHICMHMHCLAIFTPAGRHSSKN